MTPGPLAGITGLDPGRAVAGPSCPRSITVDFSKPAGQALRAKGII